jgi:hypothetical protein
VVLLPVLLGGSLSRTAHLSRWCLQHDAAVHHLVLLLLLLLLLLAVP